MVCRRLIAATLALGVAALGPSHDAFASSPHQTIVHRAAGDNGNGNGNGDNGNGNGNGDNGNGNGNGDNGNGNGNGDNGNGNGNGGNGNGGCGNGKGNGNKCIPEAPVPIGLPVSGLAVLGGYIVLVRRRGCVQQARQARPD
jgi:hypothetical protein